MQSCVHYLLTIGREKTCLRYFLEFLEYFLEILKHSLQYFQKILKKCFCLHSAVLVSPFLKPHNSMLHLAEGLISKQMFSPLQIESNLFRFTLELTFLAVVWYCRCALISYVIVITLHLWSVFFPIYVTTLISRRTYYAAFFLLILKLLRLMWNVEFQIKLCIDLCSFMFFLLHVFLQHCIYTQCSGPLSFLVARKVRAEIYWEVQRC